MAKQTLNLNPLTPQMIQMAQDVVTTSDAAFALLDKCERCNADVLALRERIQAQRDFAAGIVREFGGDAPARPG